MNEQWLKDVKNDIQSLAEDEIYYLEERADEDNVEFEWYFEEFIKELKKARDRKRGRQCR